MSEEQWIRLILWEWAICLPIIIGFAMLAAIQGRW